MVLFKWTVESILNFRTPVIHTRYIFILTTLNLALIIESILYAITSWY